jgi:hypothetical protein
MPETQDFDEKFEQDLRVFTEEPPRLTQEYVDSLRRLEPRQAFHIKNIVEQKAGGAVVGSYQEFDYEPLPHGSWIETRAEGAAPDTVMKNQADIQRYVVLFFRDADSDPIEIVRFDVDPDRATEQMRRLTAIKVHRSAIIAIKQKINLDNLPEISREFLKEKISGAEKELTPAIPRIQKEIEDILGK